MFLFGTLYQENSEGTVDDINKAEVVAETDENENADEVDSVEAVWDKHFAQVNRGMSDKVKHAYMGS